MSPDERFPDGPYRPDHWPEWARDELFSDVTVKFDWTDRLLILVGRPVTVAVRTVVSNPPGRCASKSSAWAQRILWPWRRQQGGYSDVGSAPTSEERPAHWPAGSWSA